jgi:hypothetical protein
MHPQQKRECPHSYATRQEFAATGVYANLNNKN